MSFEIIVEELIKEAQARGEFGNLPGEGKPINLTAYFDTAEEVRSVYALLKNAGMVPFEIELLQEIAVLKERLSSDTDESARRQTRKLIQEKQLQFNILMDKQKRL
jgi:hypothetical protein